MPGGSVGGGRAPALEEGLAVDREGVLLADAAGRSGAAEPPGAAETEEQDDRSYPEGHADPDAYHRHLPVGAGRDSNRPHRRGGDETTDGGRDRAADSGD